MGIRRFSPGHTPDGCKCHRDPVLPEEIVCVCRGPGVKDFQANLTRGVTRLMQHKTVIIPPRNSQRWDKDSSQEFAPHADK
ncbi:hypothetical protein NPIL_278041 [Nephila pilipes]|uniref:Uncharacterized protein n=1 Tax=Nephila pilipes TaxID=299642 RepID=A0A8X6R1U9_NEPPI|nr:hypothetical protein NPIL_278041 [Nephila pilipes]